MTSTLMSFEHVTFGYQHRLAPVLDDLNLAFPQGSITAILGPNGAGKTTLLHLALGWLKPWAGHIQLKGKPITAYTRRSFGQQVAIIPQSEHTPFEYTVEEYVLLGRTPYLPALGMPGTEDYSIARQALERAGIINLELKSIQGLSGGEHQLVLAARALAQQPQVLLLDEPTAHLDLANKARLVNVFRQLNQQGVTILLTTHEPDIALALASQVVLMKKGKVLENGPVENVISSESLSRVYDIPVAVKTIEGKPTVLWL